MKLISIKQELEDNQEFANNPLCKETLEMTIDFYKRVGFNPPWICYYAELDGQLVGSAGIKGKPENGKIEIAYGTMESFQNQGIGTQICRALVELSLTTDSSIKITARTLPENNFSTKILKKNKFCFCWDGQRSRGRRGLGVGISSSISMVRVAVDLVPIK